MPAGTYVLRAASWTHKVVTGSITLQGGDVITRDFALASAPSILLVDTGAWYYNSQIGYYQQALDDLGYLYESHSVANPISDTPSITSLKSYSITIWSSPFDSPDYIGAGYLLQTYLDGGGRLFLKRGQDIAYWDGGGPGLSGYEANPKSSHGRFVADGTDSMVARGTPGEAKAAGHHPDLELHG